MEYAVDVPASSSKSRVDQPNPLEQNQQEPLADVREEATKQLQEAGVAVTQMKMLCVPRTNFLSSRFVAGKLKRTTLERSRDPNKLRDCDILRHTVRDR